MGCCWLREGNEGGDVSCWIDGGAEVGGFEMASLREKKSKKMAGG